MPDCKRPFFIETTSPHIVAPGPINFIGGSLVTSSPMGALSTSLGHSMGRHQHQCANIQSASPYSINTFTSQPHLLHKVNLSIPFGNNINYSLCINIVIWIQLVELLNIFLSFSVQGVTLTLRDLVPPPPSHPPPTTSSQILNHNHVFNRTKTLEEVSCHFLLKNW